MRYPVPNSFGSLKEFNQCHSTDGKFCGRHGLVKQTDRREPGVLGYDVLRARRMGISVDLQPEFHPAESGAFPLTPFGGRPQISLGVSLTRPIKDRYGVVLRGPASKPELVSTARHEVGHITDRAYGARDEKNWERVDRSAMRIFGNKFSHKYVTEIGAWRAAIRDAPNNRVDWKTVHRSLKSYLRLEPHTKDNLARQGEKNAETLAAQHVALLQRYAKTLRGKPLRPKERPDEMIWPGMR